MNKGVVCVDFDDPVNAIKVMTVGTTTSIRVLVIQGDIRKVHPFPFRTSVLIDNVIIPNADTLECLVINVDILICSILMWIIDSRNVVFKRLVSIETLNGVSYHWSKKEFEVLPFRFPRLTHMSHAKLHGLDDNGNRWEFALLIRANRKKLNAIVTLYKCLVQVRNPRSGPSALTRVCAAFEDKVLVQMDERQNSTDDAMANGPSFGKRQSGLCCMSCCVSQVP